MLGIENKELISFINSVKSAVIQQKLHKLTLSKSSKTADIEQIQGKLVLIKKVVHLSLTFKYKTNHEVKNYNSTEIEKVLTEFVPSSFKQAQLTTTDAEIQLLYSKKFKAKLIQKNKNLTDVPTLSHDNKKVKRASVTDPYLNYLGVTTVEGDLIPKMADKYRQINKYLEIFENYVSELDTLKTLKIVDMGSGKGYLTFALYAYLTSELKLNVEVTGVELRPGLVDYCNEIAVKCGFQKLTFINKRIEDFDASEIDVLIALHACDTATDDAIAAGINTDAQLIICAPCCHKQVRRELEANKVTDSILKHGIFMERSCEMLTDSIRALILENKGYKTQVFEFISNEHTRKNVMLTAVKSNNVSDKTEEIETLKKHYNLGVHHLETLI